MWRVFWASAGCGRLAFDPLAGEALEVGQAEDGVIDQGANEIRLALNNVLSEIRYLCVITSS
jgi:hypothetical protein